MSKMTLEQMADELQAITDGERPRLNKTEMLEYVQDLREASERIKADDGATCPRCDGAGEYLNYRGNMSEMEQCHACDGTGKVTPPAQAAQGEVYCERSDCPCRMAVADCRHKKTRDATHPHSPDAADSGRVGVSEDIDAIRQWLGDPPIDASASKR